jgi:putative ABC transport system substrate-binding protein
LIALLGGAAVWPLAARAQSGLRHIGVLMNGAATESNSQSYVAAFVEALRQLGWTEGKNARIDIRWSAGDAALARIYAAQLIGLTPDVIHARPVFRSSQTGMEQALCATGATGWGGLEKCRA